MSEHTPGLTLYGATFRHHAIDLIGEAFGEQLVDLYGRDGKPLPRVSEAEAQERRALLEHLAYLLERDDYEAVGQVFAAKLAPKARRHVDECIEAMQEHERRKARETG